MALPGTTMAIVKNGANVDLSWSGGSPPFQLQKTLSLSAISWAQIGSPTLARTSMQPITGPEAYFRIQEQIVMQLTGTSDASGIHLTWNSPQSG